MKPYTTAREKLDYVIKSWSPPYKLQSCIDITRGPEIVQIAEALKKMIEALDGMLAEPKHITPAGIASLRQLIETQVLPLAEGTSAPEEPA